MLARTEHSTIVQGRTSIIAYGLSMLTAGAVGVIWPFSNNMLASYAIGAALSLIGGLGLIAGMRTRNVKGHCHDAVTGGLALAVGALILLMPISGYFALLWILGVRFGLAGLIELMTGIFAERERKRMAALGVLDWTICVVLMMGFAELNIRVAALMISCGFIASGIVALSSATGTNRIWQRRRRTRLSRDRYKPSYASNDTRY